MSLLSLQQKIMKIIPETRRWVDGCPDRLECVCPNHTCEISIGLADVMRVIGNKLPSGFWIITNDFFCFHEAGTDEQLGCWYLPKSLSDQSEPTIAWLDSLIK